MKIRRTQLFNKVFALLAVFTLVAAACGGSDTEAETTTATEAETTTATEAETTTATEAETTAATEAETTTTQPAEPVDIRFRLNWVADPGFLGYYMADELGFYEDEGLNVIFEYGGPNVPHPVQILAGGAADVGASGFTTLFDGITQGSDFVVFGTRLQAQPLGISSLAETPILTAADICDKKIGGSTGDAATVDALLVANGLDCTYTLIPTGFDPSPVSEGLVDGMVNYMTSHPIILTARGVDNVAVSFGDMGLPQYADMLFADRAFVEGNRDAIVGFMRANVKGWEAAFADPDTAIELMMNEWGGAELGLVLEEQRPIHDAQVPLMESAFTDANGLFWMDTALIAGTMYDGLLSTGLTDLPAVADVFDTSIMEDAFEGCGAVLTDC